MADVFTMIYVKGVDQSEFVKWLEEPTNDLIFAGAVKDWDFYVDISGGYGGDFWDSLAFKTVSVFKDIIFSGFN